MTNKENELFKQLAHKSCLKQDIYDLTLKIFGDFKSQVGKLIDEYNQQAENEKDMQRITFSYHDKGEFEFEVKFGGDVLLFLMHTNIFEIPRHHQIMTTKYVKEDKERSYCGMVHIYNFLADSLKYNRYNDAGYLIGRLMINKEKHFFIEGKKEIGMIFHSFESSIINNEAINEIITSAIEFTLNFDLLIPPYEHVTMISVSDLQDAIQGSNMLTDKRMGFKFQADKKDVKSHHKKS